MNVVLSDRALHALEDVTPTVRKAFYKQVALLEANLLHRRWRFYFLIRGDTHFITDVVPHPK